MCNSLQPTLILFVDYEWFYYRVIILVTIYIIYIFCILYNSGLSSKGPTFVIINLPPFSCHATGEILERKGGNLPLHQKGDLR